MLKQVTVFLENAQGRLASMCRTLGEADINMSALTVADTAEYGVVRILADSPDKAAEALNNAGYRAKVVEVSAIELPNVPGSLGGLLGECEDAGINIEYAYCFVSIQDSVVVILKAEDDSKVSRVAEKLGFRHLNAEDL